MQKGHINRSRGAHTVRGQTNMWRYQTEQDHAATHGVGMTSSHWTSSAWKSANSAFERADSESTIVRPQSPGGCWTQPYYHRWQCSGPMSSSQSTGFSSRCHPTSAQALCSSQSAQAGYTKHPLLHTWAASHRHIPPQSQQPTQFDRELTDAISLTVAPGRIPKFGCLHCCNLLQNTTSPVHTCPMCSCCIAGPNFDSCHHGLLHGEQDQDLIQVQVIVSSVLTQCVCNQSVHAACTCRLNLIDVFHALAGGQHSSCADSLYKGHTLCSPCTCCLCIAGMSAGEFIFSCEMHVWLTAAWLGRQPSVVWFPPFGLQPSTQISPML